MARAKCLLGFLTIRDAASVRWANSEPSQVKSQPKFMKLGIKPRSFKSPELQHVPRIISGVLRLFSDIRFALCWLPGSY